MAEFVTTQVTAWPAAGDVKVRNLPWVGSPAPHAIVVVYLSETATPGVSVSSDSSKTNG
jgi:hypothetical protein